MVVTIGGIFIIGAYFTFAAVQGDFGVVRRVQIVAEKQELTAERDRLRLQVAEMQNLTRRLSDDYLDLDLLDERVAGSRLRDGRLREPAVLEVDRNEIERENSGRRSRSDLR